MNKVLTLLLIGAVAFVSPVSAQEPDDEQVTLPDTVMEQVVKRILIWNFPPARKPRSVLVAEHGIKREWLPAIPNISFQLASDNDALAAEKGAFLFEGLRRNGSKFSINVGWGDFECTGHGNTWEFTIGKDDKVRLWPLKNAGWGRGCGGNGPPRVRGLKVGDVSPNEIRQYEFFRSGRLKPIRLGVSTKEDIIEIFGEDCESACSYDQNWNIHVDYFEDRVAFTRTGGDTAGPGVEIEYIAKPEYVEKVSSIRLTPKKRISFLHIRFPRTFGANDSFVIGDAWDVNGFGGAVHMTFNNYVDGYGLEYTVFEEETFNNLRKPPPADKEPLRKGDLISIEYSVPDSLNNVIFTTRVKADQKK